MYMDSTMTCWESLSTEASLLKPTIYSSVIILIVESSQSRPSPFSFVTKLSTLRISSYSEVTTSAPRSIVFMASTMSARDDTQLDSGVSSVTSSIACPSLLSLMRKFSACTVVLVQNWKTSTKLRTLWDLQMCLILAFCAISFGPIPSVASKLTAITIVVCPSHSVRKLSASLMRSTTLTWFAEPIRLSKTATSSSRDDNL